MANDTRIVVLHDQDSVFGPYLFEVTDPDMSLSEASVAIEEAVRSVKNNLPEEYQFSDLRDVLPSGIVEVVRTIEADERW